MNAPNHENRVAGPRLVAIVGPFQSGKTSLLEGILARGGGVAGQGAGRADPPVVVCEADPRKIPALQVILRELEELGLPRILFLNKIDQAAGSLRETLEMLQPASRTPLLLRQIPVWENGVATGFIDLALERAFVYREAAPSSVIEMPAGVVPEEKQARYLMLEKLADYDDALMEQLISDIDPPKDLVFDDR